jgi:glycosyltransferase involved in cell wall biosynthesis
VRIFHIITGLNNGGAEGHLYRLIKEDKMDEHIIVCLTGKGLYYHKLKDRNYKVYCVEMKRRSPSILKFIKLIRLIKFYQPSVVQTWMYHADLIGSIAAKIAGVERIVWGLRHGDVLKSTQKLSTKIVVIALAKLSYFLPKKIIACSKETLDIHRGYGYRPDILSHINNGYDSSILKADAQLRTNCRERLKIRNDQFLIGIVARYEPVKNHKLFVEAVSKINQECRDEVVILFAGKDTETINISLLSAIADLSNLRCVFLGEVSDVISIYSSLDMLVLSSITEGFPNVLAESMLCKTPVISTNVGSAEMIIGDTGYIVETNNAYQMSEAINVYFNEWKFDKLRWAERKTKSRQRVMNIFSINDMSENYKKIWRCEN